MYIELCVIAGLLANQYKTCDKVPECNIRYFHPEQIRTVFTDQIVKCNDHGKEVEQEYCYFITDKSKEFYTPTCTCQELLNMLGARE